MQGLKSVILQSYSSLQGESSQLRTTFAQNLIPTSNIIDFQKYVASLAFLQGEDSRTISCS